MIKEINIKQTQVPLGGIKLDLPENYELLSFDIFDQNKEQYQISFRIDNLNQIVINEENSEFNELIKMVFEYEGEIATIQDGNPICRFGKTLEEGKIIKFKECSVDGNLLIIPENIKDITLPTNINYSIITLYASDRIGGITGLNKNFFIDSYGYLRPYNKTRQDYNYLNNATIKIEYKELLKH